MWTALEPGELVMFQCGDVAATMRIPVPEAVLEKLRNPAFDASASAPRRSPALAASGAGDDLGDDPVDF